METIKIGNITKIKSKDGFVLVSMDNSVITSELYLGIYDTPSNYHEIEKEEAEKIQKKQLDIMF